MTLRAVHNETQRDLLLKFVRAHKLPFTVDITSGRRRSTEQNRLQRLWLNEIAEQLGDRRAEEIRGYCKLHHGVPILRNENEAFRLAYDQVIRPLPYEAKLKAMMVPLDMPVTRIMDVDQKTRYLNAVHQEFSEQGLMLTEPIAA